MVGGSSNLRASCASIYSRLSQLLTKQATKTYIFLFTRLICTNLLDKYWTVKKFLVSLRPKMRILIYLTFLSLQFSNFRISRFDTSSRVIVRYYHCTHARTHIGACKVLNKMCNMAQQHTRVQWIILKKHNRHRLGKERSIQRSEESMK